MGAAAKQRRKTIKGRASNIGSPSFLRYPVRDCSCEEDWWSEEPRAESQRRSVSDSQFPLRLRVSARGICCFEEVSQDGSFASPLVLSGLRNDGLHRFRFVST